MGAGHPDLPDTPEQTFEGIDLLDATKIVPEELAPVQPIGLLTLDRNPSNYFAETEQVAFHVGHLVPGIDVTDDPLLAGRLFSYLDTQITRLAGPNFHQIPINRPHAPVNDMLRDGFHQQAVHTGVAPYKPNSLDGGCPFFAGADTGAFVEVPVELPAARKVRKAPASFADHFSQVRLFWLSMTPVEREHIIAAYTFELGKCWDQAIKERQLQALANIDTELCTQVATGLGLPVPTATAPAPDAQPSPALSQIGREWPADGRVIGIVTDASTDADGVRTLRRAVLEAGMVPLVIAPAGGTIGDTDDPITVQRTFATARSIEFDALIVAGAPPPAPTPKEPATPKPAHPARARRRSTRAWHSSSPKHSGTPRPSAAGPAPKPSSTPPPSPPTHPAWSRRQRPGGPGRPDPLLAKHRVWDRFPGDLTLPLPPPRRPPEARGADGEGIDSAAWPSMKAGRASGMCGSGPVPGGFVWWIGGSRIPCGPRTLGRSPGRTGGTSPATVSVRQPGQNKRSHVIRGRAYGRRAGHNPGRIGPGGTGVETLRFDSGNLEETEAFMSRAYAPMRIGGRPRDTRARIVRTAAERINVDKVALDFTMAYDAGALNRVALLTLHTGALTATTQGRDEVYGPGESFLITQPDRPYTGEVRAARYTVVMFDTELLTEVAVTGACTRGRSPSPATARSTPPPTGAWAPPWRSCGTTSSSTRTPEVWSSPPPSATWPPSPSPVCRTPRGTRSPTGWTAATPAARPCAGPSPSSRTTRTGTSASPTSPPPRTSPRGPPSTPSTATPAPPRSGTCAGSASTAPTPS